MEFGSLRQQEQATYNKEVSDFTLSNEEIGDILNARTSSKLNENSKNDIIYNLTSANKIEQLPGGYTLSNGYEISGENISNTVDNPLSPVEVEAAVANMKDGYVIHDPRRIAA